MSKNKKPINNYENLYEIEPDWDSKFVKNINSKIEKQSCLPKLESPKSNLKTTASAASSSNITDYYPNFTRYLFGSILLLIGSIIIGIYFAHGNDKGLTVIDNIFVDISLLVSIYFSFINIFISKKHSFILIILGISMFSFIIASIANFILNSYHYSWFMGFSGMVLTLTGYVLSLSKIWKE